MAATMPPMVWAMIAFDVSLRYPKVSSIAVWVLRYPLQHIPIAVNTAIAFPSIHPADMKLGTRPKAAPTAPRAVIGNAMR